MDEPRSVAEYPVAGIPPDELGVVTDLVEAVGGVAGAVTHQMLTMAQAMANQAEATTELARLAVSRHTGGEVVRARAMLDRANQALADFAADLHGRAAQTVGATAIAIGVPLAASAGQTPNIPPYNPEPSLGGPGGPGVMPLFGTSESPIDQAKPLPPPGQTMGDGANLPPPMAPAAAIPTVSCPCPSCHTTVVIQLTPQVLANLSQSQSVTFPPPPPVPPPAPHIAPAAKTVREPPPFNPYPGAILTILSDNTWSVALPLQEVPDFWRLVTEEIEIITPIYTSAEAEELLAVDDMPVSDVIEDAWEDVGK